MSDETPSVTMDGEIANLELAYTHPASDEAVRMVLDATVGDPDGRSGWTWVRLRNGDLLLGLFPRGATYEALEVEAQWPGSIPERPVRIPAGWRVIAYRKPVRGERYFRREPRAAPLLAGQSPEKYTIPYWIVERV